MTDHAERVREEYLSGYSYGYERAEYDIRNGMQVATAVLEEVRVEVTIARDTCGPYTRAHALGHCRGYRHAVMDDWARWAAQRETRRQEREARS